MVGLAQERVQHVPKVFVQQVPAWNSDKPPTSSKPQVALASMQE